MQNFLSLFDTRTSAFLVAIAFFIEASAIGMQAYLIRTYKGVGTALLGNLCIAIGFSLNLFQGILPDWVSIILANFLLLQGPNLFQISFSRFLGQTYSKRIIVVLTMVTLAVLIYFTHYSYNTAARIVGVSFCVGTSLFIAVRKLWKARREPYRLSIWLTMIPLSIYGLFLYIRIFGTVVAPPESTFSNTPLQTVTFLLLFLISFLWTLGFILMVSQRLQIDLKILATIDTLTRIPNRHATQTFFEKEISRIKRHGGEFSILLIDIDNFKQINDSHGHAMGDMALIKAAQIFNSSIRKQDIVGRWGGEEFLMILPDTPMQNAQQLAERLRASISKTDIGDGNTTINITISAGVASATAIDSLASILKKADDALYVAKATKNAVRVASEKAT